MGLALEVVDWQTGEIMRVPLPCGRNSCAWCRRRNAYVTAMMFGIDAAAGNPPVLALTTTTERHSEDWELRETTAQFVRKLRERVAPEVHYAWEREWTTGLRARDGRRRTHYHWLLKNVPRDAGPAIVRTAQDVYRRRAGAWRHDVRPVWDAAGFGRYIAGLVGHHLKEAQRPPDGWKGRRVGTSRGYYSIPAAELRRCAEVAVAEERLIRGLESRLATELPGDGQIPGDVWEELLEHEYVRAIGTAPPRVVPVAHDYWEREAA